MTTLPERGVRGAFGFMSVIAPEHDCGDCGRPAYHMIHDGETDDWLCADCACKHLATIVAMIHEGRGR